MERTTLSEQEDFVKTSLFYFLRKNIPNADLSSIDDIVLRYVVSILEELTTEDSVEEAFDVQGFCEMMSAYVPDLHSVHQSAVCQWMFELEATLREKNQLKCDQVNLISKKLELLPLSSFAPRSHSNSESNSESIHEQSTQPKRIYQLSETSDPGSDSSDSLSHEERCPSPQLLLLHEMFPEACAMEVRHCLAVSNGDLGLAAQIVLHRQEAGQSINGNSAPSQAAEKKLKSVVDDEELKSRIIARYSYVDKDEDNREHRPVGPKSEPKKLVRYRDNKIVSLKGERFTEIKKDEEDEIKKNYVSLKPTKNYRSH